VCFVDFLTSLLDTHFLELYQAPRNCQSGEETPVVRSWRTGEIGMGWECVCVCVCVCVRALRGLGVEQVKCSSSHVIVVQGMRKLTISLPEY
jgi:hypothetical protein